MTEAGQKRTLREWRQERGLTILQLAARANVGLSTITEIEANRRSPTVNTAESLADVLGVSISDIRWPQPDEIEKNRRRSKQSNDAL